MLMLVKYQSVKYSPVELLMPYYGYAYFFNTFEVHNTENDK